MPNWSLIERREASSWRQREEGPREIPRADNSHRGSGDREPFVRASDTGLEELPLEGEYLREAFDSGSS